MMHGVSKSPKDRETGEKRVEKKQKELRGKIIKERRNDSIREAHDKAFIFIFYFLLVSI